MDKKIEWFLGDVTEEQYQRMWYKRSDASDIHPWNNFDILEKVPYHPWYVTPWFGNQQPDILILLPTQIMHAEAVTGEHLFEPVFDSISVGYAIHHQVLDPICDSMSFHFGKYHAIKGLTIPVFELTSISDATHVLVQTWWASDYHKNVIWHHPRSQDNGWCIVDIEFVGALCNRSFEKCMVNMPELLKLYLPKEHFYQDDAKSCMMIETATQPLYDPKTVLNHWQELHQLNKDLGAQILNALGRRANIMEDMEQVLRYQNAFTMHIDGRGKPLNKLNVEWGTPATVHYGSNYGVFRSHTSDRLLRDNRHYEYTQGGDVRFLEDLERSIKASDELLSKSKDAISAFVKAI